MIICINFALIRDIGGDADRNSDSHYEDEFNFRFELKRREQEG